MAAVRYTNRAYSAAQRAPGRKPVKAQTRRRPSFKFFIIAAAFTASVTAVLVLLLSPPPTAAAEIASMDFNAEFDMLIVRDEVAYQAVNYGKTEFIAREGAHVEAGDPVVKVYELGYSDETLSELLDLRKTILDYETQVSRAGVIDPSLDEINSRIDTKARQIQNAVTQGSLKDLLGLELDMEGLLGERMTYLKSVVVPDDKLREYQAQEQQLTETINGWSSLIAAEKSGTVSFYFDGYESLMTTANMGSFTEKTLEDVMAGKTLSSGKDEAYVPLYRVVSEDAWYVVMLSDNRIPEMFMGNVFSMVFDDYLNTQYTGKVYNIQELENNNGYVYTIQIEGSIGPMLGDRRVSVRLYTKIESLRIPRPCLKNEDGVDYVQKMSGETVPVLVIGSEGEYVFIQTFKGQAALSAGELLKK